MMAYFDMNEPVVARDRVTLVTFARDRTTCTDLPDSVARHVLCFARLQAETYGFTAVTIHLESPKDQPVIWAWRRPCK